MSQYRVDSIKRECFWNTIKAKVIRTDLNAASLATMEISEFNHDRMAKWQFAREVEIHFPNIVGSYKLELLEAILIIGIKGSEA